MGRYLTLLFPTGSGWSFKPDSGAEQTDVCLFGMLASQLATTDAAQLQLAQFQPRNAPIETNSSVPSLLPCVGTKPVRTRCFIVMTLPGKALAGVTGAINRVFFSAFQNVVVNGNGVTFDSVTARGPNPNGSFTTRAPENSITLEAHVTPANLASEVKWTVEDDPSDEVASVLPASPPAPGSVSSFTVPQGTESEDRWPASHPGTLKQKAIAYKVTASIVFNGRTYASAPVTVRQDEYDALRQEYIDFDKNRILARAELGANGDPRRNSGDYSIWPSSAELEARMPVLQELATRRFGRPLTVTGGFRNPVHHHIHKGYTNRESQHLYGSAADFRIADAPFGMSPSQYFYAIRKIAWDPSVVGCFEPEQDIRRGANGALNHAHVDWRTDCSTRWGGR